MPFGDVSTDGYPALRHISDMLLGKVCSQQVTERVPHGSQACLYGSDWEFAEADFGNPEMRKAVFCRHQFWALHVGSFIRYFQ